MRWQKGGLFCEHFMERSMGGRRLVWRREGSTCHEGEALAFVVVGVVVVDYVVDVFVLVAGHERKKERNEREYNEMI